MFPSVLIMCFHFSIKHYFISKVLGVSGSACVSPLKCYSYIKMTKNYTVQYSPKHPIFSYPTQLYAVLVTILC